MAKHKTTDKRREAKKQKRKRKVKNKINSLRKSYKVIDSPQGVEMMSEVLEDYAAPLLEAANDYEQISRVIGIAAVFWNASVQATEAQAREKVQSYIDLSQNNDTGLSFEDSDFDMTFKFMFDRKQRLFSGNHRLIVNYEVSDLGDGEYHIEVASTMP